MPVRIKFATNMMQEGLYRKVHLKKVISWIQKRWVHKKMISSILAAGQKRTNFATVVKIVKLVRCVNCLIVTLRYLMAILRSLNKPNL